MKKNWYVFYRFYDPVFRDNPRFKNGKLVIIKGMNHLTVKFDRVAQTKQIITAEIEKLQNKAYNPISHKIGEVAPIFEIKPSTGFNTALVKAEQRISAAPSTKRDLKSILRFITKASVQLGYSELAIQSITRKHIKQLLLHIDNTCAESANRFNKIRSYLMMLFKELIELEAVEANPLRDLSKKKCVQRLRQLPSAESRNLISEFLFKHEYRFWIFMQIFFHSGGRITELINVQACQVNLLNQTFFITVKKGNAFKEVLRPIKDIALPFWIEALTAANPTDFIFSKGLKPGPAAIQSYQITKRWNRHVKVKLGIAEDFYSLKHLNLDQTAALLNIEDASVMASHGSSTITAKYYAVGEKDRQNERLKKIQNPFGKNST